MAYDEGLAERVREIVGERPEVSERTMFGGLAWMIAGNMACAVMSNGGLVVRLDPEDVEDACRELHVGEFGRDGMKPMRGFVRIDEEGVSEDADLARWVDAGAARASSLPPK